MIEGIEWLFIGIIVLLLIFYDPKKIVQLSKALAQAKKEYEKASSTLIEQIEKESRTIEEAESQLSEQISENRQESQDEHIIRFAKMLNIQTYGKTLDEIKAEINKKTASSNSTDNDFLSKTSNNNLKDGKNE
ncbi:MAG: hypothetical protein QXO46_08410 [Nitrososphaerota archaeon]